MLTKEPVPPAQINEGVPRDLEIICLKCLSKEPARRYASAADLAEDLARWSRREPIRARPVPRSERVWLWARRNPGLAVLSGALVVTLLVGTVLRELALRQAREARAAAENLVDFMNVDLTERLRPLGRLELLDNVNAKVEQYYKGLPIKETTPAPLARKARFYQNNASVLRDEGRLKEAETNALAALAILLSLQERQPLQPDWPAALTGVYATLVKIHSDTKNMAAARAESDAEEKFAKIRLGLQPHDRAAVANLASACFDLGNVLLNQKLNDEAAGQIDRGVALLEGATPSRTNDIEWRTLLADGWYQQGLVQLKRRELASAFELFSKYQATYKGLVEADPANAALTREWMVAESRLGETFLYNNEWDKALEHFTQSDTLVRKLSERDPMNLTYQKDAAWNLRFLAEAATGGKAPESEILDYRRRAYEACRALAEQHPEDNVLRDRANRSLIDFTEWLKYDGHPEAISQTVEQEITNAWKFLASVKGVTGHHRRFIDMLELQDTALAWQGQNARRVEILNYWLDKAAAILPHGAVTGGWRWTIGQLRAKLAHAHAQLKQWDASREEFQRALPLQAAFAADEPQDDEVRDAVNTSFQRLSAVSDRLGDVHGTLVVARQFLDWSLTNRSALAAPGQVRPVVGKVCLDAAAKAEGTKRSTLAGKLIQDCLAGVFPPGGKWSKDEEEVRTKLTAELAKLAAAQVPP